MSNSYAALQKARLNANMAVRNTNKMASAVAETVDTFGQASSGGGSIDLLNTRFQGLTQMSAFATTLNGTVGETLTARNAVISNNVTIGAGGAGTTSVNNNAVFAGSVEFKGQVTGVNFSGVVSSAEYSLDKERTVTQLAELSNYKTSSAADITALQGRATTLESRVAPVSQLVSVVGNSTLGLVQASDLAASNISTLQTNVAGLYPRVGTLEDKVNGTAANTYADGLVNRMTDVRTRLTTAESNVSDLRTQVYGDGTDANKGLAVRMTEAEAKVNDLPGQITSAVNAVVAGAPAALDTLKEVADQLNRNENGVVKELFTAIGTKANDAAVVKLDGSSVSGGQTIKGAVNFENGVTGVTSAMVTLANNPSPVSGTVEFALSKALTTTVDKQDVLGVKNFKSGLVVPNADKIYLGVSSNPGDYVTLSSILNTTTVTSTQDFDGGLRLLSFSDLTLKNDPSVSLHSELSARLDTRFAAGEPVVNSSPQFENGVMFKAPGSVYFHTDKGYQNSLAYIVEQVGKTKSAWVSEIDGYTYKRDHNYLMMKYTDESGAEQNKSMKDYCVNTFGNQDGIYGNKVFKNDVTVDWTNLKLTSFDSSTPTALSTLFGRDRVFYLTGTDTQTVSADKKFTGTNTFDFSKLKLHLLNNDDVVASDYLMNRKEDQEIISKKTFTGTTGIIKAEAPSNLKIGDTDSNVYFLTAGTDQNITGSKTVASGTKFKVKDDDLVLVVSGVNKTADTYLVNTESQQQIYGRKFFEDDVIANPANWLVRTNGAGTSSMDITTKKFSEYFVTEGESQTVSGSKRFHGGVDLPMNLTYLRTSADATSYKVFDQFVANVDSAQTFKAEQTFGGGLKVEASKLSFSGSGDPSTFLSFMSRENLLYVDGANQTIKGNKSFQSGATLTISDADLKVRVGGNANNEKSLADRFVNAADLQDVYGVKTFKDGVKVEDTKLTVTSSSDTEGKSLSSILARDSLVYVDGAQQTISGVKEFSNSVYMDGTKVKIKLDTNDSYITTDTAANTFVNTKNTEQTILGKKTFAEIVVPETSLKVKLDNTSADPVAISSRYLTRTGTEQNVESNKTWTRGTLLNIYGDDLTIFTDASNSTTMSAFMNKVKGVSDNLDQYVSNYSSLSSQVSGLSTTANSAVQKSSTTAQVVDSELQFSSTNSKISIEASKLSLTSFASTPNTRTADNIAFLNGPSTQTFTSGFTIDPSTLNFTGNFSSSTLSAELGGRLLLSTNTEQKLTSGNTSDTSRILFGDKKLLSVYPDNVQIRKTLGNDNDYKDLTTYIKDLADTQINGASALVRTDATTIKFTGSNLTVAMNRGTTDSDAPKLYLKNTDSLIFNAEAITNTATQQTLSTVLGYYMKTENLKDYSDFSNYYTSTQSTEKFFAKSANFSLNNTYSFQIYSDTASFESNSSLSLKGTTFTGRMIENVVTAVVSATVSLDYAATAGTRNGSSIFLMTNSGSAFTGLTFGVQISNFPVDINKTNQSITVAFLIEGTSTARPYVKDFSFSPNTTGFTSINASNIHFANGATNIDLGTATTKYILQSATFIVSSGAIQVLSSVAPYINGG